MRDRRSTHVLLIVLFGLLALGPFLHAHLGFSKITGFHIAGFDSPHVSSTQEVQSSSLAALSAELTESESPAVGVSASLVRYNQDPVFPDGLTLQCVVAVITSRLVLSSLTVAAPALTGRPSKPRPGLPPPALAPPALS